MPKTYTIEHLDPELGPWSSLEYQTIARECHQSGAQVCLSSITERENLPSELRSLEFLTCETKRAEEIYADEKARVCLLDPAAEQDLSPEDWSQFDVFLFGGILGDDPPRGR